MLGKLLRFIIAFSLVASLPATPTTTPLADLDDLISLGPFGFYANKTIVLTEDTILDGSGKMLVGVKSTLVHGNTVKSWRRILDIAENATCTILNVTFVHGKGNDGSSDAGRGGGGTRVRSSGRTTFSHCAWKSNKGTNGGAVTSVAGGLAHPPRLVFSSCHFQTNHAASRGGGINLDAGSTATLRKTSFEANMAKREGGGGLSAARDSAVMLTSCTFLSNIAWSWSILHEYKVLHAIAIQEHHAANAARKAGEPQKTFSMNVSQPKILGGGMLLDTSSVTLTGCLFQANFAQLGAGIGAWGGAMNVSTSTFAFNTVNASTSAVTSRGTAILLDGQAREGGRVSGFTAAYRNVSFSSNRGSGIGTVLLLKSNMTHRPASTFAACSFESNAATSGVGLFGWKVATVLKGCSFMNNTAVGTSQPSAGAMLMHEDFVATVTACVFRENSCAYDGGAVKLYYAMSVEFSSCLWASNRAGKEAGALHMYRGGRTGEGRVNVRSNTFVSNRAGLTTTGPNYQRRSGAFLLSDEHGPPVDTAYSASFENCLWRNNSGPEGGGISAIGKSLDVGTPPELTCRRCTFNRNRAVGAGQANGVAGKANGGGLFVRGIVGVNVSTSAFSSNTAHGQMQRAAGGGISATAFRLWVLNNTAAQDFTLFHTSFVQNTATIGGGLAVGGNHMRLIVRECGFQSNVAALPAPNMTWDTSSAGHGTHGLSCRSNPLTCINNVFGGGAAWLGTAEGAVVVNSTFDGNRVQDQMDGGGALLVAGGNVTLTSSTFRANVGALDDTPCCGRALGGGVSVQHGIGIFEDVVFDSNVAARGGGAHMIAGSAATTQTLHRCRFTGNAAMSESAQTGGGLELEHAHGTVARCHFELNTAERGGGLAIAPNASSSIVAFQRQMKIQACVFRKNVAQHGGGAVWLGKVAHVAVEGSTFDENRALDQTQMQMECGGAVLAAGTAKMTSSTFRANEATRGGAFAMTANAKSFTLAKCAFEMNVVRHANNTRQSPEGGAVSASFGASSGVTSCSFYSNVCEGGLGGGLFATAVTTVTTTWPILSFGNSFVANAVVSSAHEEVVAAEQRHFPVGGGAIAIRGNAKISWLLSTFQSNVVGESGHGGAAWFEESDGGNMGNQGIPSLYQCTFVRNEAADMGGAAFVRDHALVKMIQVRFEGNRAHVMGGAVGLSNVKSLAQVFVDECQFAGNWAPRGESLAWHNVTSMPDFDEGMAIVERPVPRAIEWEISSLDCCCEMKVAKPNQTSFTNATYDWRPRPYMHLTDSCTNKSRRLRICVANGKCGMTTCPRMQKRIQYSRGSFQSWAAIPVTWWSAARVGTSTGNDSTLADVMLASFERVPACRPGEGHPVWTLFPHQHDPAMLRKPDGTDKWKKWDWANSPLMNTTIASQAQDRVAMYDRTTCRDKCLSHAWCLVWVFYTDRPCSVVKNTSLMNCELYTEAQVVQGGRQHMPDRVAGCVEGRRCPLAAPRPGKRGVFYNAVKCATCAKGKLWSFDYDSGRSVCKGCLGTEFPVTTDSGDLVRCEPCLAGQYCEDGKNYSCPVGKYQPGRGRSACMECEPGFFATAKGAVRCTVCPPGLFMDDVGAVSCAACPVGHFQVAEGATACSLCARGTFTEENGTVTCSDCDTCRAGYQVDLSLTCSAAKGGIAPPDNTSALVTPAYCEACPAGTYGDISNLGACKRCPQGYISADTLGSFSCTMCPPGQHAAVDAKSRCVDCPAGRAQPAPGRHDCPVCQSGEMAPVGSTECDFCPEGYRSDVDGCRACEIGTYAPSIKEAACSDCAAGQYQDLSGKSSCHRCHQGQVQAKPKNSTCVECSAGTFASAFGFTACKNCKSGQFQRNHKASGCNHCAAGQSQAEQGKSMCIECGAGLHASTLGATVCKLCETKYEFVPTARGASICKACADNAVVLDREGHPLRYQTCYCKAGFFQPLLGLDAAQVPNATTCEPCPHGSLCNDRSGGEGSNAVMNFEGRLATQAGYWRDRDYRTMATISSRTSDGEVFLPCSLSEACRGTSRILAALKRELLQREKKIMLSSSSSSSSGSNATTARVNATTNSTNSTMPDAELVGQCLKGHTGIMCESCQSGWSPSSSGLCIDCGDVGSSKGSNSIKLAVLLGASFVAWAILTLILMSKAGGHSDVARTAEAREAADDIGDAAGHAARLGDTLARFGTLAPLLQRMIALDDVFASIPWPSFMSQVLSTLKIFVMQFGSVLAFVSPCNLHVDIEEELYMALFALPWALAIGVAAKVGSRKIMAFQRFRRDRDKRKAERKLARFQQKREKLKLRKSLTGGKGRSDAAAAAAAAAKSTDAKVTRQREFSAKVRLLAIGMLVAKLAHPGISAQLLVFGVCESVGDSYSGGGSDNDNVQRVMRAAVDVPCSTNYPVYARVVAISIVGLILVTVGLPIGLASMIYRDHVQFLREEAVHATEHKEEEHHDALGIWHTQTLPERLAARVHRRAAQRAARLEKLRHRSINWIVAKWKPHLWWWFIVEMLFSLVLISILQLATGAVWKQYYTALITAALQAMLPALVRPHVERTDDWVAICGAGVYFALVLGRMPRYFVDLPLSDPNYTPAQHAAAVAEANLLLDATFLIGLVLMAFTALFSVVQRATRRCSLRLGLRGRHRGIRVVPAATSRGTSTGPSTKATAARVVKVAAAPAKPQSDFLRRCPEDLLASVAPRVRQQYETTWVKLEQMQRNIMATAIQAAARGRQTRNVNVVHVLAEVGRTQQQTASQGTGPGLGLEAAYKKAAFLRANTTGGVNIRRRPSRHRQLQHSRAKTDALLDAASAFTDLPHQEEEEKQGEGKEEKEAAVLPEKATTQGVFGLRQSTRQAAADALLSAAETFTAAELSGLHEEKRLSDSQMVAIMRLRHEREHADYRTALASEAERAKARARKKSLKRGFLHHFHASELSSGDLRAAFAKVDRDKSGLIDVAELVEVYRAVFKRELSEVDARELMRAADQDGDSDTMSLEEMMTMLQGGGQGGGGSSSGRDEEGIEAAISHDTASVHVHVLRVGIPTCTCRVTNTRDK